MAPTIVILDPNVLKSPKYSANTHDENDAKWNSRRAEVDPPRCTKKLCVHHVILS